MSVLRLESPRPTSGQHLRPMRECTRICLARAARRRGPVVLAMQHSILQTRRAQVEPRPSSILLLNWLRYKSLRITGARLCPTLLLHELRKNGCEPAPSCPTTPQATAAAASPPQQRTAAWQCLREPPAAVFSVLQAVKKAHYWSKCCCKGCGLVYSG